MKSKITLLLCLVYLTGFSQDGNFTKKIKLYYNLEFMGDQHLIQQLGPPIIYQRTTNLNIGYFSPAISFTKNRWFQEIELSKLSFGKKDDVIQATFEFQDIIEPISGELATTVDLRLRYELGVSFFEKNENFSMIIGLGFQPYFKYGEINPKTSMVPPVYFNDVGAVAQLTPHFQIKTKNRWTIDLAPYVGVIDFGRRYQRIEDAGLSIDEQVFTDLSLRLLPLDWGIRLGASYQL